MQQDYSGISGAIFSQHTNALSNQQLGHPLQNNPNNPYGLYQPLPPPTLQISPFQAAKQPEKKSMFKEITTDIKGFVLEHRGVIYFIAFALIVDHFFFRGAFKARLQGMAEKVVTKVEEKIK